MIYTEHWPHYSIKPNHHNKSKVEPTSGPDCTELATVLLHQNQLSCFLLLEVECLKELQYLSGVAATEISHNLFLNISW